MQSVDQIFEKFGGPTALGRLIGVKPSAASEMRRRASIPVDYWPRLVASAKKQRIDLNYAKLVSIHAHKSRVPSGGAG